MNNQNEIINTIRNCGIIPIATLNDPSLAVNYAQSLYEVGLPVIEITFRTESAEYSIRNIVDEFPDMLVGAGTVLSVESVKKAIDAGAKFLLSPGFNRTVVDYCTKNDILIFPGCSTPSDIELALAFDLHVVKLFPVETLGGVAFVKALSGPYKDVQYIPTGGVDDQNLNDYLKLNNVIACGGSWIFKPKGVTKDQLASSAQETIKKILGFNLDKIYLNGDIVGDFVQNNKAIRRIEELFQEQVYGLSKLELDTKLTTNEKGYITIRTKDIYRAIQILKNRGIAIKRDSKKFDQNNNLKSVTLNDNYLGLNIQIVQE